jgi:hypothetical protein
MRPGRSVGVARSVGQPLDEIDGELARSRRPKADRGGDALADRDAVVAPARWQVQHVARLEQPLARRRELGEHPERHVGAQARLDDRADAPAPAAPELQEKDVVRVDVRPDAAAVRCPRAHHVVEPRVGDEAEAL